MTIEEEIQLLGPLKNVAAVIVDYTKPGARLTKSEFHRQWKEWTLKPDNWINLKFTHERKYRIHVSIGVYETTLDRIDGLEIKPGRFPTWSKFTIENVLQLPAALQYIQTAYYSSNNSYRGLNGSPKRPKTTT